MVVFKNEDEFYKYKSIYSKTDYNVKKRKSAVSPLRKDNQLYIQWLKCANE